MSLNEYIKYLYSAITKSNLITATTPETVYININKKKKKKKDEKKKKIKQKFKKIGGCLSPH